jgi:hypothetical protein
MLAALRCLRRLLGFVGITRAAKVGGVPGVFIGRGHGGPAFHLDTGCTLPRARARARTPAYGYCSHKGISHHDPHKHAFTISPCGIAVTVLRAFKGEITNHDSGIILGKEEVFEGQEIQRLSEGQDPSAKFRGGPHPEEIPQFQMSKADRASAGSTPAE